MCDVLMWKIGKMLGTRMFMHTLRQYARANVCGTRCLGFVKSADEKMWPRRKKKNMKWFRLMPMGVRVCAWAFVRGWRGKLCRNELGKVEVNLRLPKITTAIWHKLNKLYSIWMHENESYKRKSARMNMTAMVYVIIRNQWREKS